MARRVLFFSVLLTVFLGLAAAEIALAKAHVPLGRVQICTAGGQVRNIAARNMQRNLSRNACRLTACVFNDTDNDGNLTMQFVFQPGESCDSFDGNGDGFCDVTGAPTDIPKRLSAVNVTTACTDSF